MAWIVLTKKLPVHPSPPKMSIVWATPWPDVGHVQIQKERYFDKESGEWWDYSNTGKPAPENVDVFVTPMGGGEPNWALAMKIHYRGEDIRVFRHEFNPLPPERMRDYVFGMEGEGIPTHELVENNEASRLMLKIAQDSDLRQIYDAALVDGCNHPMAEMVAMGIPIEEVALEFPPIGWYRPLPFVLDMYCYEDEQSED